MKIIIATIATLTGVIAGPVGAANAPTYDPAPTREACQFEDGPNWPCYWDAGKRGNHRGASYWIGRNGVVHYVDGVRLRLER